MGRKSGDKNRKEPLSGSAAFRTFFLRPVETTRAILLRRIKFSETSLILTWFGESFGKIKTVARGAMRPKSPFAGKIDLFFDAEIAFTRSKRSELHVLKEVSLREPFDALRRDYRTVQLAAYFAELLDMVTEPEQPAPELYDLLRRALTYLTTHPAAKRPMLHFESELARLLGIAGPEENNAAMALGRVYHRLPVSRRELLEHL